MQRIASRKIGLVGAANLSRAAAKSVFAVKFPAPAGREDRFGGEEMFLGIDAGTQQQVSGNRVGIDPVLIAQQHI